MGNYFLNNFALDLNKKVLTNVDAVDKDVIHQSLEAILLTGVGERVFEDFGSFLQTILFHRLDENNAENLLDEIISTISRYENRITVISNSCALNISRQTQTMRLKIVYYINSDGAIGEFNKKIVF